MTAPATLVPSAVDPDVGASLAIYERMKPLKDALGVKDLSDTELQLFALVARHTGLDPFTRQIYAIKRGGRVTHQTGIDGYRSVAERTGQYAGSDEAAYEECTCGADDSPRQHPSVARVVVHRILANGHVVDQVGVARWHELKPAHTKPQGAYDYLDSMWWRQPYNQLAKCAEANGLRKAFPRVLAGVYIAEEMQGAPVVDGHAAALEAPTKTNDSTANRVAARRAQREAQAAPEPDPRAPEPAPAEEGSFVEAAGGPTLAESIRAAAAASDLEGRATPEAVKVVLDSTFKGWDRELVLDGIRVLFGDRAVDQPLAAQVEALRVVGESITAPALVAGWRELVGGGKPA